MSVHKYTSWGRTRQPKNLAGAHEAEVLASDNVDPSAATDGYTTENQRYLHLYFENSEANDKSIDVHSEAWQIYEISVRTIAAVISLKKIIRWDRTYSLTVFFVFSISFNKNVFFS